MSIIQGRGRGREGCQGLSIEQRPGDRCEPLVLCPCPYIPACQGMSTQPGPGGPRGRAGAGARQGWEALSACPAAAATRRPHVE